MRSPLPDSSALEAGIIEDERPTRLSRVQDNVRNLLRSSILGSVVSSPTTPNTPQHHMVHGMPNTNQSTPGLGAHGLPPAIPSPLRPRIRPEVLPSPSFGSSSTATTTTPATVNMMDFPQPPESYHGRLQRMAHQSALFNSRAVEALNHPDLSDPSLEELGRQKTEHKHRKGCKRSRRSRKVAQRAATSRAVLCMLASLLLAALVATYVSIATTGSGLTPTFHILFVLGICLATILCAHSVVRLFSIKSGPQNQPLFIAVTRHAHHRRPRHRHHTHRHHHQRQMPSLAGEPTAFVPPMPIPVHVPSDDVREDANIAQPSAGTERAAQTWDKEVADLPNPPPAYGRWRGSVRVNPDLLHWQAIQSPMTPDTPMLPSPTYEEAMATAQVQSPPSYVTRDSPERQREMQEARAGITRLESVEPEMVEVRTVGVGLAM